MSKNFRVTLNERLKDEDFKKEYNELKCNRIAQSYILMCIF